MEYKCRLSLCPLKWDEAIEKGKMPSNMETKEVSDSSININYIGNCRRRITLEWWGGEITWFSLLRGPYRTASCDKWQYRGKVKVGWHKEWDEMSLSSKMWSGLNEVSAFASLLLLIVWLCFVFEILQVVWFCFGKLHNARDLQTAAFKHYVVILWPFPQTGAQAVVFLINVEGHTHRHILSVYLYILFVRGSYLTGQPKWWGYCDNQSVITQSLLCHLQLMKSTNASV